MSECEIFRIEHCLGTRPETMFLKLTPLPRQGYEPSYDCQMWEMPEEGALFLGSPAAQDKQIIRTVHRIAALNTKLCCMCMQLQYSSPKLHIVRSTSSVPLLGVYSPPALWHALLKGTQRLMGGPDVGDKTNQIGPLNKDSASSYASQGT